MIPKIIWQTHQYKDYESLPLHLKKIASSWINLNQGWEYRYHSAEDREKYVNHNHPYLYELYVYVSPILQSDIWRYLVVYDNGGVYADMDSFCIVPLDYMLKNLPYNTDIVTTKHVIDKNVVGKWVNNSNFAAVKDSIILESAIDLLKKYTSANGDERFVKDLMNSMCTLTIFNICLSQNKDIVHNGFIESHSKDYKKDFNLEMIDIDYYGKNTKYIDVLNTNNLKPF